MIKKLRLKLNCKDANHLCDKTQYNETSFLEKVRLRIHLVYCHTCKKYTKHNIKLTQTIQKSNISCLDKNCKDAMRKTLDNALKNQ